MLTCREASRLLSEALDRALPARDRRALEEHLATCRGCRECARQFAALRAMCAFAYVSGFKHAPE